MSKNEVASFYKMHKSYGMARKERWVPWMAFFLSTTNSWLFVFNAYNERKVIPTLIIAGEEVESLQANFLHAFFQKVNFENGK